jgi:LacI family transcriptional regulator
LTPVTDNDYSRSVSTIADVARLAGVSTASVSRYLSGQRVREHEAIEKACTELRYRPDPTARSLRSGRTRSIGVVVPDITNPYYAAVVKGIQDVTLDGPYHVFLSGTGESAERQHDVLVELTGRADGLILIPATEQSDPSRELRPSRTPVVLVDREAEDVHAFDSVVVDNAGGARLAAEHLLELGHERLAMIGGPLNTTVGRERHAGFVDTLAAAGIEMDPSHDEEGGFNVEGGYQAALRLLGSRPAPTAIFSTNNLMTTGLLRAVNELGVRTPGEVSVIGFDDLDLGALLTPPLTCISRPTEAQGALAMRLLLRRLEESDDAAPRKATRIVMDVSLTVRGSTGPAPTPAPKRRR